MLLNNQMYGPFSSYKSNDGSSQFDVGNIGFGYYRLGYNWISVGTTKDVSATTFESGIVPDYKVAGSINILT